jgi:anti-anti-sigma factor
MNLELISDDGRFAVVRVTGEISQIRFRSVDNPLEELLGPNCYRRLVLLDGSQAEWIDSSGISWLIGSHKRLHASGGRFVIFSLSPRVHEVLQFCRIDTILNVANDEAAARSLATTVEATS